MKILQIRTVLATVLLSLCIGQVYAWSLLSNAVNSVLNHDMSFAFSLAILFLGLSAAFMGKFVERNPKATYILSVIFFVAGFLLSGFACSVGSVWMFYAAYGVLFGCSCGLGYVAPIKTLMLYFRHNKAVASAIAILSFGLAKSVASPLYTYLTSNYAIDQVFYLLALIYTVPLIVTSFLFRKFPVNYKPPMVETIDIGKTIRTLPYISIWLFFFINIACGLAFISQEAQLYSHYGVAIGISTLLCTLSAVFNAGGRFGFAWVSDKFGRYVPYIILFALSSILCLVNFGFPGLGLFVVSVMLINSCYGGGFSALPALLASKYGITNTSTIHSLTLSAWGIAGIASLFLKQLPVDTLFITCFILYGFNLLLLHLSKK